MNQNPFFLKFNVDSIGKVKEVFDILHDASVDEKEIIYNAKTKILDIWASRIFLEDPSSIKKKRFIVFSKETIPLVRCHLHLNEVDFFQKHSTDKTLSLHTFNECFIDGDRFFLNFCEVLELSFIITNLSISGYFEDLDIVPGTTISSIGF